MFESVFSFHLIELKIHDSHLCESVSRQCVENADSLSQGPWLTLTGEGSVSLTVKVGFGVSVYTCDCFYIKCII